MRMIRAALSAVVCILVGCTVDTHQRCDDDPTACPTGFYCDGVWCFPDGVGPGRDARRPDERFDARPDALEPTDMTVDDATMDDATVEDLGPDQAFDVIGALTPADRIVSGAVNGRDALRVEITGAPTAGFALVEPGADCGALTEQGLVEGGLVIGAADWRAFSPDGVFDLCVSAGGEDRRFDAITVDEIAPSIVNIDAPAGLVVQASEPLSTANIGMPGCGVTSGLVIDPDDPTRASADDPLVGKFGIVLVDAAGNPSPCFELALFRHECAVGADLTPGISDIPLNEGDVIESTCDAARFDNRALSGLCEDCGVFAGPNFDTYVHIALIARRPRLMTPQVFATRVGLPAERDLANDAVLLNRDTLLMSDGDRLAFWRRQGGVWLHERENQIRTGTGVTAIRHGDNQERFAVANPGGVNGFGLFNGQYEPLGQYALRLTAAPTRTLISLSDRGNTHEMVTLDDTGDVSVHILGAGGWLSSTHAQDATALARLGLRGIVFAREADNRVELFEEQQPTRFSRQTEADMTGPVACLATGDWTGDGIDDVVACVGGSLVVLPVQRREMAQFGNPMVLAVGGGVITDLVVADADGDGRVDALARDTTGRVHLLVNAPGNPVHTLDLPHRVRALRGLGQSGEPLDVVLLQPANRSISRLRSPAAPIPATPTEVLLAPDEEVVGVGDIDCDQRADLLIRDTMSRRLRVEVVDEVRLPVRLMPPIEHRAEAATLGDLNGDGFPDVMACFDGEMSRWLANAGNQLPRGAQPLDLDTAVDAMTAGDWSAIGRADVVLRTNEALHHLYRGPGETILLSQSSDKSFRGLLGFAIANLDARPGNELFVGRTTTQHAYTQDEFRAAGAQPGGEAIPGLVRTVVAPVDGDQRLFTLQHSEDRMNDRVRTGDARIMSGHLHDVAVGDFNMDGQHEVVVLAEDAAGERWLHTFRAAGVEYVASSAPIPVPAATVGLRAGDVNGDGRLDLIQLTQ